MKGIVLGTCALLIGQATFADTVVFNTFGPGNTYDPGAVFYVGTAGTFAVEQAAQFVAQSSGFLSSVELGLTRPPAPVNVFLYSDMNGLPNTANQIFLGSAIATGLVNQTNNSVATVNISADAFVTLGSTYWLVLKPGIPGGLTYWNFSSNLLGPMADSVNDSSWFIEPTGGPPRIAAFRISAVPESSVVWLNVGLTAFLLFMRHRADRKPASRRIRA